MSTKGSSKPEGLGYADALERGLLSFLCVYQGTMLLLFVHTKVTAGKESSELEFGSRLLILVMVTSCIVNYTSALTTPKSRSIYLFLSKVNDLLNCFLVALFTVTVVLQNRLGTGLPFLPNMKWFCAGYGGMDECGGHVMFSVFAIYLSFMYKRGMRPWFWPQLCAVVEEVWDGKKPQGTNNNTPFDWRSIALLFSGFTLIATLACNLQLPVLVKVLLLALGTADIMHVFGNPIETSFPLLALTAGWSFAVVVLAVVLGSDYLVEPGLLFWVLFGLAHVFLERLFFSKTDDLPSRKRN
eukprot:Colp12_sorted_trinity150504_noHs@4185